MPKTFASKAQQRLFQGVAHGMKPKGGEGPSVAVAKQAVAENKGKPAPRIERVGGNPHPSGVGSRKWHY
jgi:hypothetical protein